MLRKIPINGSLYIGESNRNARQIVTGKEKNR